MLLVAAQPLPTAAAPAGGSAYEQAVQQAYDIIKTASPPDAAPAEGALQALEAGTGHTQPEIISDLTLRPPAYDDARARLVALLAALQNPASTADPAVARQRLHDVMSMSRYDALHRPPSLLDRVSQWINDRINDLLALIFGRRAGAQAPEWLFYIIGITALLFIAVMVFRAARGRMDRTAVAPPAGPRPAADYFAEADALSSRGDYVRAIRALCAGVAATLAGERTWEGSPLTVREIFKRAPDSESLVPLLHPFEAAIYGGRSVDRATYDRAERVAAPYRRPAEEKAA